MVQKSIVMIINEGSIKIVNFMTFGAGILALGRGYKKIKNLLLYSGAWFKCGSTKCIVMMTKEVSLRSV